MFMIVSYDVSTVEKGGPRRLRRVRAHVLTMDREYRILSLNVLLILRNGQLSGRGSLRRLTLKKTA